MSGLRDVGLRGSAKSIRVCGRDVASKSGPETKLRPFLYWFANAVLKIEALDQPSGVFSFSSSAQITRSVMVDMVSATRP